MFNTDYGYPVLQSNPKGLVYGELYEVNSSQLAKLDELEGYRGEGKNNYYDRIVQRINTDQGIHEAYVYIMNKPITNLLTEQIHGGDWKVFRFLLQSSIGYIAYGSCMDDVRFKKANVNHYFQKVIGLGVLDGYTPLHKKIP